jgi:Flp pilus assembly protein TadD
MTRNPNASIRSAKPGAGLTAAVHSLVVRREVVLCLALFVGTVAVFGPSVTHGFLNWDDRDYVYMNGHVLAGLSRDNVAWAFATFHCSNWHPLTWLSLQLDAQLFGSEPWGFHLTNVLLHGANAALLFCGLLLLTQAAWRSAIVAGLFALHPLHVESVAWIAERKDVLSGFFWMSTCLAYGWYANRPSWPRYLLTLAAFALGLMTKPMLVTLPFVLLLLDYWPLNRFADESAEPKGQRGSKRQKSTGVTSAMIRVLVEKVPFFILALASSLITARAQQEAIRSLQIYPLTTRLANAVLSYCNYIWQAVWPVTFTTSPPHHLTTSMGLFYPHLEDLRIYENNRGLPGGKLAAAAAVLIAATIFACIKRRELRYLRVGWVWYLGTLVPVIGIVMVGAAGRADRYTYIPLIGLFIAAVWGIGDWCGNTRAMRIACSGAGIVLAACAILSLLQLSFWRNNIDIWRHTLEVCGESSDGYTNLADAYLEDGRCGEAAYYYREAIRLDANSRFALNGLGVALLRQGKVQEAIAQYALAVRKNPDWVRPHYNFARALVKAGKINEAASEYEAALRCDGEYAAAHSELAELLSVEGRFEEAARHFQACIAIGPPHPANSYGLGACLVQMGKFSDAVTPLAQAVEMFPEEWRGRCLLAFALASSGRVEAAGHQYREVFRLNPQWLRTLDQEARLKATDPNPQSRNGIWALLWSRVVCQATANQEAGFLDTLAAAYAETGDFAHAVDVARRALAIASASKQDDLARQIGERLQRYENKQPYRSATAK